MSVSMPSEEEMKAEIERLRAENEKLKKPARGSMSLKVSEKADYRSTAWDDFPSRCIANSGRSFWRWRIRFVNSFSKTTRG